jgi:simple sugar transport system ATP-binding protein
VGGHGTLIAEMRSVSKSFYGVLANRGVDLELRAGEVHALLGENGAGKSTLCSILAGLYRPDSGEVLVDGEICRFRSPQDALAAGVGMVYQHYRLVSRFTVAENMMLGHPDLQFSLSSKSLSDQASAVMDRFGIHIDPTQYVADLSVGEQQRVEILKLLGRGVRVLVLDEPTAVLAPAEAESLFTAMRALASEGRAVVFVSHKLGEVMAVSDRVTVLRDGARVGCRPTGELDQRSLARLMVDRDVASVGGALGVVDQAKPAAPPAAPRTTTPALEARDLFVLDERGHTAVNGVSLNVHGGEIVGVAGVAGNGQRQLADALAGLSGVERGEILMDGELVTESGVRDRIRRGCAYVPEDRLGTGVAPSLSLEENLALRSYWRRPVSRGPFLALKEMSRRAEEEVARFDIKGVRPGLPVSVLSGGNLQRAILAREISGEPSVLISASPTRGLDVGAIEDVHALLRKQREAGVAVLLLSEDLEELLTITDRLLVLFEGRVLGEMATAEADRERVGLLMAGVEDAA